MSKFTNIKNFIEKNHLIFVIPVLHHLGAKFYYAFIIFFRWRQCHLVAKNWPKKLKSSLVDRFWCLMCLNNCILFPNMTRLFASGATNFLVAKMGTKDPATSCSVYIIWNNWQILTLKVSKWPYWSSWQDRIIASTTNTFLVTKKGT